MTKTRKFISQSIRTSKLPVSAHRLSTDVGDLDYSIGGMLILAKGQGDS
jgi:hypothetical protein